jgi:hypothetical protein
MTVAETLPAEVDLGEHLKSGDTEPPGTTF